jgi:hypothetical protein
MNPGAAKYIVGGLWLLVAVVVVIYPLRIGTIRAGRAPISKAADPGAFWRAYIVSTVLFFAMSIVAAILVRSILL